MSEHEKVLVKVTPSNCCTSNAWVSSDQYDEYHQRYGTYISLEVDSGERQVFRLQRGDSFEPAIESLTCVRIDHWPTSLEHFAKLEKFICFIRCVSPVAGVRIVRYLELAPVCSNDVLTTIPLSFLKYLMRDRILPIGSNNIALREEDVDYGEWSFRAFYPKLAKTCTELDHSKIWAGILASDSLVLLLPIHATKYEPDSLCSMSRPIRDRIGSHGVPIYEYLRNILQRKATWSYRNRSSAQASIYNSSTIPETPKSVLLHALGGMGKTKLVDLIANELDATLVTIDATSLLYKSVELLDLFHAAIRTQPSIIFFDDIELLFPKRSYERNQRSLQLLPLCLRYIKQEAQIAVIGTVSNVEDLDVRVRQLFDDEMILQHPENSWMVQLLNIRASKLPKDVASHIVAHYGQNLSELIAVSQKYTAKIAFDRDSKEFCTNIIKHDTLLSSKEQIGVKFPEVDWSDIGGFSAVKQKLKEMIVWPIEMPWIFARIGISPPLGMILHGPPGTGKTMLAKAAARASGSSFISLSASDLIKSEFGESEKAVTRVFDLARASQPCLIFIDEFQSLFGKRTSSATMGGIVSQLLIEMDSLSSIQNVTNIEKECAQSKIFVLAATNALDAIDQAFLQPGRFENVLYVGLPNEEDRRDILRIQLKKMPCDPTVDIESLIIATNGYSAASMVAMCRLAALEAMNRVEKTSAEERIIMNDFEHAV